MAHHLTELNVKILVPEFAGLPQIHWIVFVVSLSFISRRRRLARRHALLLRMSVQTGAGMSHLFALGAVHEVRRARLDVLAPKMSELKSDLV